MAAPKIAPPRSLLVDIRAWQAEAMATPAPAMACGALLLLKMHLWHVGPIPDNDVALARITATSPTEWKKLRKALEPLFSVRYSEWVRTDWSEELEAAYEAVNKARAKSQKGHAARWGNRATGNASGTASGVPAGMLNINSVQNAQKPQPKPPKPRANEFQPEYESDVAMAEAALGIGGGV